MDTQPTAPIATMIRLSGIALLALAASLAGACTGSDGSSAERTPSESGPASAEVDTAPAPEDISDLEHAAVAAYERYLQVAAEASAIPDPDYPQLEQVAADEALEGERAAIQRLVDNGWRSIGEPTLEIEIKDSALDSDPVLVVVVACEDSTDWLIVDAETGEPVPDEEYGRRHIEAMVELRDGHWYVTELAVRAIGSC